MRMHSLMPSAVEAVLARQPGGSRMAGACCSAAFTRRRKSCRLLAQAGTWGRKKGRGVGEQADIYERITGRIIEQMETASAAGWQKPWITAGQNTLQQVNATTKREYRGVNVLMLWAAAEITGYQDGRWASFKQ